MVTQKISKNYPLRDKKCFPSTVMLINECAVATYENDFEKRLTALTVSTLSVLSGLRVTGNPKAAGSNSARDHFFAMLISCSRCSDGAMCLPFW